MSARWFALEGGEGSGKSTQAALLAERLGAVLTREPGGTAIGARLRELLLDAATVGLDARAETLLMAADRAQHVAEVVAPALAAGRHVVSDRSAWSSLAYQGAGRELGLDEVRAVSDWASGGRWPDVVVLLEVPEEEALRRTGGARDRMEAAGVAFHRRVADAFATLADEHGWLRVDGTGPTDEVARRVWQAVEGR